MRRRRSQRYRGADAELDITAFMNLMIVLVPVLLLSMVFTHTTVIDLNFPSGESAEAAFHLHGPRLRLTYAVGTCDELFVDGFESGDTTRWN